MRICFRFRLRTALALIALLSPLLYGIAVIHHHGGLAAFRKHHAVMAYHCWSSAYGFRIQLKSYQSHAAPGHSCPACLRYGRPMNEVIEETEQLIRAFDREARWHEFLSGRPIAKIILSSG